MKYLYIAFVLSILPLISCQRNNDNGSKWNEEASTYVLDDLKLEYVLPSNADNWMIKGDIPDIKEIKFCGVDVENNVCLSIITPHVNKTNVLNLTSLELKTIVSELIFGERKVPEILDSIIITKSSYLNKDSWYFETLIPFNNESLRIKYMGYLFDSNGVLTSIMLNTPYIDFENSSPKILDTYFSALKSKEQINSNVYE